MADVFDLLEKVSSPEELADFVLVLRQNLLDDPDSWENWDLGIFLEAIAYSVPEYPAYENGPSPICQTASRVFYEARNYDG